MHLELGARRTVGVHYATWILSDENYLAPPQELGVAARERGASSACVPGEMGRTVVFPIEVGGGGSGGMSPVESVESGEKSLDGEKGLGEELAFREVRGGKSVLWC
jgi:hypothetical protein